jgi:hypothetical protein
MPANGTVIMKRREALLQQRSGHDQKWDRMAPLLAPSRKGITGALPIGSSQNSDQYDSTTMMAAELAAHFIAGHIINPAQRWLGFSMPELADDDDTNEWLEECRDIALRHLSASSFYAEGAESLVDWIGFGTGFTMNEERPQPSNRVIPGFRGFHFSASRTGRFLIAEGVDGRVDTAMRDFTMSARNIVDAWGNKQDGRIPEKVTKAINEGRPDDVFDVTHSIYPRARSEQGAGYRGMPWASCWVEHETKTVMYESGYRMFPGSSPRYHRTPGPDPYGRGRGDLAFPDSMTLNTAKRMGFEDWALKIRPPMMHAHDAVHGTIGVKPGFPVSVNTHNKPIQHVIMPWETGSKPEVSQIKEEELRKSIRQIFYVEQILALLEIHKSEMTALEFARKIELIFRLIGPVYGRLEWEWLYPEVDIIWDTLWWGRAFPPPPPIVEQTSGQIAVQFDNPIARAMRSGDADSLMFALNDTAPLWERFPQMLDWVEPDDTMKGILNTRGVPAKWRRSEAQVATLREARAEQEQKELQLADAQAVSEIAKNAAPAVKTLNEVQGGRQNGAARV